MCMACNNGKMTKKKIALFSSIAVAIGASTYFIFITTNNPAIAATIPLVLSFAVCPAMCAGMGGILWLINRKKKNSKKINGNLKMMERIRQEKVNETAIENSCCNMQHGNKNHRREVNQDMDAEYKDMKKQQLKEKYKNKEKDKDIAANITIKKNN